MLLELSEPQVAQIINTAEFQSFFDRSSRIVERALNEHYDVAVDYTMNTEDKDEFVKILFYSSSPRYYRALACLPPPTLPLLGRNSSTIDTLQIVP